MRVFNLLDLSSSYYNLYMTCKPMQFACLGTKCMGMHCTVFLKLFSSNLYDNTRV